MLCAARSVYGSTTASGLIITGTLGDQTSGLSFHGAFIGLTQCFLVICEMASTYSESTDRGWAWCVLLSTFTSQMLYAGAVPLVGIYIVEWQEYFNVGTGSTSLIALELTFGLPAIAVLLGASCQRFGCRLVAITGGVIGALSTLLASFSTQLWQIHVCSTIAGLAYGAAYFPGGVVIRYYFKKRLGMANGVTYAGIGAGFFVMAPLLEKLCSVYGWKGAMFIHAAINANFILCGVILRRTKMEQKIMAAYKSKPSKASDEDSINGGDLSSDSFCKRILRNIDKTFAISRLVKNVHFVTLCLVSILSFEGHMSVLVFTAPKLVLELGLSKGTASLVMSAYGITGLLSRALHGFLLDFKLISLTNLYILSLVISGVQPMFNPLITSTAGQFALIVVYGIGAGIMVPTTMLVCRKYVALDAVPSAIGLVTAIGGLGNVLSTQLMGQLSDATGSFAVPFYISGAFFWLSAVVMLMVTRCIRFEDGDQDSTVVVPEVAVTPNGQEDILSVKPTALTTNGYHQVSTDVSEFENWESAI